MFAYHTHGANKVLLRLGAITSLRGGAEYRGLVRIFLKLQRQHIHNYSQSLASLSLPFFSLGFDSLRLQFHLHRCSITSSSFTANFRNSSSHKDGLGCLLQRRRPGSGGCDYSAALC